MKHINISEYNIIRGVPPVMPPEARVAIDTEFTEMDKKKLHRPTGIFACATFYAGGKDVYIIQDVRELAQAFQNIEQAGWIFHNAKFDIFHLRRFVAIPTRMKMWDTMLVEQVMYSGLYDEFNLAACVRRHLDILLEKETRDEFETHTGEMTPSQVEYACIDTIATHQLFQHQRSIIDADDLKIWKEIELPFLWTLLSIGGITLDQEKWLAIAKDNGEKADAIQAKYGKEVQKISEKTGKPLKATTFDGINLASPKQVKEEFARLGYKLEGTGEEFVSGLVEKCEFAKELLDFRTLSKRAGTYGESYIADHVEADGKIYTDYFQIGAITGRMCVGENTILNTTLGDFRISDLVLTGNENCSILTHKGRYKPILQTIYKGKEDMFKVTLDNGSSIECTMSHRFLTDKGWKMLKEITNEDNILTPDTIT
jgi:DNA polymerase I-like protein with 3'-5' exonuclease and polymerase domains